MSRAVTVTAKSLILDLLSTLRGGSMPVKALVGAAALFGVRENGLRVALARLYAARLVERDERGRYRLGPGTLAVSRRVASWRRIDERLRPWDGGWAAVHLGRRKADRRGSQALRFLGFRALEPGLCLRPDNLAGGIEAVREQLTALGLRDAAVFAVLELDPARDLAARSLWDAAELSAAYLAARRELEQSELRLAALPDDEAMVESFLVGGRGIRQLVLDPLLPEPIVRAADRAALVTALRRYDRVGRARWARFLERYDVPHLDPRRAPADLRLADATQHLE